MNQPTPTVSDEEQAAAYLAWRRGEAIQTKGTSDPEWVDQAPNTINRAWLIRRKPAPQLRAWRPEEVPLGAIWRLKTVPSNRALFTGVGLLGLLLHESYGDSHTVHTMRPLEWFSKEADHSTDGGKTWLPCGVLEETPPC